MSTHYHIISAGEGFSDCWRPVAEHDFITVDGTVVKKDEVGGIMSKDVKLCQTDLSWVDYNSYVSGSVIINNSLISNSHISADCKIEDCSIYDSFVSVAARRLIVTLLRHSTIKGFNCVVNNGGGTIDICRSDINNVKIIDNMDNTIDVLINSAELHDVKFIPPLKVCREKNPSLYGPVFAFVFDNRDGSNRMYNSIIGKDNVNRATFASSVDFSVPPINLTSAFAYIDSNYTWRNLDSIVVYLSADNMHIVTDINGYTFELTTDQYNNLKLDKIFNTEITFGWTSISSEARLQLKTLLTYAYSYFVQFVKQ